MKKLIIAASILLAACGGARAQSSSAIVVATCGTPPVNYTAGSPYPITQSTAGALCTSGGGGGGGGVAVVPANSGGTLTFDNAVTTTVQSIKASTGQLYGYHIFNPNSTVCWVQLFNLAAGSVVLGTTVPFKSLGIPALGGAVTSKTIGAAFDTAISVAVTTTRNGNSACAIALDVDVEYF